LKTQKAAKISVVKLNCHFGQQQWLALKGHTHASGLQHHQIICPIANGCWVNRIDTILFAITLNIGGFGVAIENWRLDRAHNFVVAQMHLIGAMVMKTAKRSNWANDDAKSTRH
jgi:hypothetical protein